MRKILSCLFAALLLLAAAGEAGAHFAMVIPSRDIVTKDTSKEVTLDIRFMHPFEGGMMDMARPDGFGVSVLGERSDLAASLKPKKVGGASAWEAVYKVKRPGDHVFFLRPAPYFEPAEGTFIVHYTKVVVNALGLETGWDAEVGLPAEIVSLTRPYGLWSGNVFQGVVKSGGKPVPYARVEVEYYNEGGKVKAPSDPYVTQAIRADGAGVFTYAMPRSGWWGFAALTDGGTMKHADGKEYPVEAGAVIWVRTRAMK